MTKTVSADMGHHTSPGGYPIPLSYSRQCNTLGLTFSLP